MIDILSLPYRKKFSAELPKDSEENNFSRQVIGACFSLVETKVPRNPEIVHVSHSLLQELNLSVVDTAEFLKIVSGAKTFNGFEPYMRQCSVILKIKKSLKMIEIHLYIPIN